MVPEYLPAYITAGVGLVALVVLVVVALGAVRRFTRAAAALRSRVEHGRAAITAAVPPRWAVQPATTPVTAGEPVPDQRR